MTTTHTARFCRCCGGTGKLHFPSFSIACYHCNGSGTDPRPRVGIDDFPKEKKDDPPPKVP